ncbi:uncharacterized protein N7506_009331 [Penicillium brevicompactum]|uniref:uncharacterized protein n=1 Tax=Penicillium brevicompactum TaxID=5074 RepID=UPI0025417BD7|nr:uncharacterized protein N7506_009331 [Penicillium brevicompactum]KAJ5326229.1 hypothetical protein N7506_009331 [Penicillium brevicompactum]
MVYRPDTSSPRIHREEYRVSAPAGGGSRWRADLEKKHHVVESRFPKEAKKVSCDGMTKNHREVCFSPAIYERELAVFEIAKVPGYHISCGPELKEEVDGSIISVANIHTAKLTQVSTGGSRIRQ